MPARCRPQNLVWCAETPRDPARLSFLEPRVPDKNLPANNRRQSARAVGISPGAPASGIMDTEIFINGHQSFTKRVRPRGHLLSEHFAR